MSPDKKADPPEGHADIGLGKDWLFNRQFELGKETVRQAVWLAGLFVILAFFSMGMNLSALEQATFSMFFFEATLSSVWPIRVMLFISVLGSFSLLIYSMVALQKNVVSISYLAQRGHPAAIEMEIWSRWMIERHPGLVSLDNVSGMAVLASAVLILLFDCITLLFSFF